MKTNDLETSITRSILIAFLILASIALVVYGAYTVTQADEQVKEENCQTAPRAFDYC